MNNRRTAIIIGAGIGGLAAGLALRRAGWTIRIHERAAAPRELGFGLGLAPNALAALGELGVAESVVRAGASLARIEFRLLNGRVLRQLNVNVGLPAVVALRPELHGALLRAIGDDALTFGSEGASFTTTGERITVQFTDGRMETADLLVGADGIHSIVRHSLHPNEPPPRPSGYCALRGVAHGVDRHLGGLSGIAYLDEAIEAATVRASRGAVYWYLSLRAQDVPDPRPSAILSSRWAGLEASFRAILSATKPEDMPFDQLLERDALHTWSSGPVTLLGDAAHPVLPHTGQGAALALEDAVALGLALAGARDIEPALRRYEAVRSRRTRAFIRLGPRIARITTTRNRLTRAIRALAIQWVPDGVFARAAQTFQRDPHRDLRP